MCHFITLVTPPCDETAVRRVMERHGRRADPYRNPSFASVLLPGEMLFLTTPGHCDCGTALSRRGRVSVPGGSRRRSQKGWSAAKVGRAEESRRRARGDSGEATDSLALWAAIVMDLHSEVPLPRVSLFLHFYSSGYDTELGSWSRTTTDSTVPLLDRLGSVNDDEITMLGV